MKSKSMATFISKKSSQSSWHKQSSNIHEMGNISKISVINDLTKESKAGYATAAPATNNLNDVFIKPNIFGKNSSAAPKKSSSI